MNGDLIQKLVRQTWYKLPGGRFITPHNQLPDDIVALIPTAISRRFLEQETLPIIYKGLGKSYVASGNLIEQIEAEGQYEEIRTSALIIAPDETRLDVFRKFIDLHGDSEPPSKG